VTISNPIVSAGGFVPGVPLAPCSLKSRSANIDSLVVAHYVPPPGVAVLAVGGYGRKELFPYSDVDLLILCENATIRNGLGEPLSDFLRTLWDFGLRVSQSVRTREECAQLDTQNVELAVSLLDRRFLSGDQALFASLVTPSPDKLAPHIVAMTRARHIEFHNTIYHLEPNVKDAPGGLRDLQVIHWLTGRNPAPAVLDLLSRIRCSLHRSAGRDQNILDFAMQDEIAAGHDPSELMRDYFQGAQVVYRLCQRELANIENRRGGLLSHWLDRTSKLSNSDFTVVRGTISMRTEVLSTLLITRLLFFVGKHGLRLAPDLEDRLALFTGFELGWPELHGILELPFANRALRIMHATGLLAQVFPELNQINGRVVRDFYHRYTVDEHTLVTIDTAVDVQQEPFVALGREIENRGLLLIALLFHDSAKGTGESHAEPSAELALGALKRIGMPQPDLDTVARSLRRLHGAAARPKYRYR
jgi:[protein-PII] uridylyltransferase